MVWMLSRESELGAQTGANNLPESRRTLYKHDNHNSIFILQVIRCQHPVLINFGIHRSGDYPVIIFCGHIKRLTTTMFTSTQHLAFNKFKVFSMNIVFIYIGCWNTSSNYCDVFNFWIWTLHEGNEGCGLGNNVAILRHATLDPVGQMLTLIFRA